MNSQELETAKRIGANITVVIWRDDGYGLIDWKQRNEFGRPFGVEFGNPDFVAYARVLRHPGLPPDRRGRPAADAAPRARRRRPVGCRRADRLPREPAPDRAPGRADARRRLARPTERRGGRGAHAPRVPRSIRNRRSTADPRSRRQVDQISPHCQEPASESVDAPFRAGAAPARGDHGWLRDNGGRGCHRARPAPGWGTSRT